MPAFTYLKGIYNIMPTPFHADGSLDTDSLGRLTEFVIGTGVDGLTILGVLGEAEKLLDAERDTVVAGVLEATAGRVPVCVGTSHASTEICVVYSKRAQEMGAKAVMVAPLKLARPNDEALRRHYLTVASAIDLPVVVQDHPASSNVYMSVEVIARIAEDAPQCRFLKLEDEPSPSKVSRVREANPQIDVFGGLGGMMFLEELRHGAVGTMTGFGFPEILVDIYRHYRSGDIDGATEVFYRYCPLIRFENQKGINLGLRKHIYQLRGAITTAHMRRPAPAIDKGTLDDLHDILRRLGLMAATHTGANGVTFPT
jgi:4-hydroxy-tetrahydrodipicolinate synthase